MFGADAPAEAPIRAALEALLDEERIGFAYGALACGADIVAAEALLDRGVELHVVLPFEEEDFLLQSVLPGGPGWEARYRACRDRAASVVFASPMAFFGNPAQYGYASRTAMGLARLRAEHLAAEAVQIAIWDGVAVGWAGRHRRRRRFLGGGGRADPDRRSGRGRARPRAARAAGDDTL